MALKCKKIDIYNLIYKFNSIVMKQNQEVESSTNEKNVYQRIREAHIDTITDYFCRTMDRYYQSALIYREKCKTQITYQLKNS